VVTPQQILALAEELAGRDDEAAARCSISRAYYAAFLHCRGWLETRGQAFAHGTQDHRGVHDAMLAVNRSIGQSLRYLRRRRNNADYDVGMSIPPELAQRACVTARAILQELGATPPNTTN
jgi:uncharacterized protein (UPF0332 family)